MKPDQNCAWLYNQEMLQVRSELGAWTLRLWPEPELHTVVASEHNHAPPLYLELADAPVVRPHLAPMAVAGRRVPARIRRCVVSFAAPREQFQSLQLLHALPEALPMLEAVPVLGRTLVHTMQQSRDWPELAHRIRTLRGRDQTAAVMEWLYARHLPAPPTGALVKALQKARQPREWDSGALFNLRQWLVAEPKTVGHLEAITAVQAGAWDFARRTGMAPSLHIDFYRGIRHAGRELDLHDLYHVFRRIYYASEHQARLLRPIRSPRALAQRLFEAAEAVEHAGRAALPTTETERLPSPMAVPEWIRPLERAVDLVVEGKAQRHCVGGPQYREKVRTGRGYVYAIEHPEGRATAWVRPTGRAGVVELTELQAFDDVVAPSEVWVAVSDWVDAHNRWAMHRLHGGPMPLGAEVPIPEAARDFVWRSGSSLESFMQVLVCAGLPNDRLGRLDPAEDELFKGEAPPVNPWEIRSIEYLIEDSLLELVRETTTLRDELARMIQRLRGLDAPGPDEQDAILLEFARCAVLFEKAFSTELNELDGSKARWLAMVQEEMEEG